MKKIIIANWKMNPSTKREAQALFQKIKKINFSKKCQVVVCPPFPYLYLFNTSHSFLKLGAQNCFWEQKGAFTGEVSPKMLQSLGVKYVILGHSERRKYFNENEEIINKKVKAVLSQGLSPVVCVGEEISEREQGKVFEVLKKQLSGALKGVSREKIKKVIIAYEPVWAIGTGKNCPPEVALETILFLRKVISQLFNKKIATQSYVLYGGSVNANNAHAFLKEKWINGLLVGGSSLKPQEWKGIIKSLKDI